MESTLGRMQKQNAVEKTIRGRMENGRPLKREILGFFRETRGKFYFLLYCGR